MDIEMITPWVCLGCIFLISYVFVLKHEVRTLRKEIDDLHHTIMKMKH